MEGYRVHPIIFPSFPPLLVKFEAIVSFLPSFICTHFQKFLISEIFTKRKIGACSTSFMMQAKRGTVATERKRTVRRRCTERSQKTKRSVTYRLLKILLRRRVNGQPCSLARGLVYSLIYVHCPLIVLEHHGLSHIYWIRPSFHYCSWIYYPKSTMTIEMTN